METYGGEATDFWKPMGKPMGKPMETTGWRYIETGFKQTFGYHSSHPVMTCYNML
jgi:hypothetical protein